MGKAAGAWGFVVLVAAVAGAGQTAETPKQYLILRPAKPIVTDGKLDEWDMAASPYVISPTSTDPLSSVHSNEPTNPPKGDADISGRGALAWDEQYLYVAGQMVDDHLMGIKPDSVGNQGPPGWGCDSLMVLIHSFRQPMKTNSPYSKTPFLGLRYAPTGPNPRGKLVSDARALDARGPYWVLTENSKWAVTETPQGYNVEAAIPWKDLGFKPQFGEKLFIGFLAADVDPDEALNQMGWGFHGEPKDCPVFRLAAGDLLLGLLTLSSDEVPADKPWAVRAELDSMKENVRLEAIRVRNAQGRVVLEAKVGLDVPKGKTGQALQEFKPGAIAEPGSYVVELVAWTRYASITVVSEPFRVVAPAAEPPVVRNLSGEIHHMQPDRVAHNAWSEHRSAFYKHNYIKGKEDYVPYIRRYVEPGLKGRAQQYVKSKNRWAYREAFHCMALYRITGDQEYVPLARDLMGMILDLQQQEGLDWFLFTNTARYRYLTWLKDPASQFAPPDAEKRYRAILHKTAEKPDNGLFNESGTHNRVWHRYAIVKAARLVAEQDGTPIDPRIKDYTDYHDKLIGEVGDDDDNSAGYHWVFFDAASALYFHTGDWDAFVKHKGFRRTMARYVEMVSPSGACVPFGSGSGWPEVGHSMWAYEWMSNLTKDGRFRWTSHRIAEYYYNHLDYRASQYHLPFDTARDNFVQAYLFADEGVQPAGPSGQSRVTWRHPMARVPLEEMRARPGLWRMKMDGTRWVPDKLVLASGADAQALWGLVELLPAGGHCGELPGNLTNMLIHDSALLAGQGYYELTPDYNNLVWIEDLDGLAADPRPITTEVPIFVEDPAFTFARIKTMAYQNLPVVYTRDILFLKNGFLVVKDRVRFESTMKVRLGPCWQTRCLGPQCGENWFNTYFDQMYYTGLGLGRGVQAMRNPSWDLLVYFAPRPGRKHTVQDRFLENVWRAAPVQLRQVWSGMAQPGQEITFTTVLLPHVPSITPREFLEPPADSKDPKRIEIAHDDDGLTVVRATSEMDPMNKIRWETWVMLNDTGKLASAGPLASDGLIAVIGHDHAGQIDRRVLVGGTVLRYRDADEAPKARKLEAKPLQMPPDLIPAPK
jgi:hypothetical protein